MIKFAPKTKKGLLLRVIFILVVGLFSVTWWYARMAGIQLADGRESARLDWCEINVLFCGDAMHQRLHDVPFVTIEKSISSDVQLSGVAVESATGMGVILVHPFRGIHQQMMPLAAGLYDKGVGSIALDLRGHGKSSGDVITFGPNEMRDLQAAYNVLVDDMRVSADRVAIIGWGYGGSMAMLYAARNPNVKVIVADSMYANFDRHTIANITDTSPALSFIALYALEKKLKLNLEDHAPENILMDLEGRSVLALIAAKDEMYSAKQSTLMFKHSESFVELWQEPEYQHLQFYTENPILYVERVTQFIVDKLEDLDG